MKTTTQKVYNESMPTIRKWIKEMGFSSFAEFIKELIEHVEKKKAQNLYNRLPRKVKFNPIKPLEGVKIRKTYTGKKFVIK